MTNCWSPCAQTTESSFTAWGKKSQMSLNVEVDIPVTDAMWIYGSLHEGWAWEPVPLSRTLLTLFMAQALECPVAADAWAC